MTKRKRHSEEQIVRILREAETSNVPVVDFVKKKGINEVTFYRWRKKHGGLEVADAKRLKQLETENGRLKKLIAERDLDIEILKEANKKKW